MKVEQLALSEKDMQTKALPGEAPGDVSDAKSKVVTDDQLQSPDDWSRIQGQIESGELDAQIEAEEAAQNPAPPQPQATPQQDQQGSQQAQPQQQAEPAKQQPDQAVDDDDNGSSPPDISLFGDLQPDPTTGQKPQAEPEPVFKIDPEEAPQQNQQVAEPTSLQQSQEDPNSQEDESQPNHPGGTQYRFRGEDEVEDLAFHLKREAQKAGKKLHLEEALKVARETIGDPSAGQEDQDEDLDGLPQSVDEIRNEIRRLEDEAMGFQEEMEFDKAREVIAQKRKLEDSIPKVEERQEQRQNAYVETFQSSSQKAAKLYPMVAQEGSEFAKACTAMDALLESEGDERFHDPNKPILIARAVAQKMGIMPEVEIVSAKPTPQPQASETSPRAKYQAAPTPVPASGQSRSGGTSPTGAQNFDDLTEDSYQSLKEQWSN